MSSMPDFAPCAELETRAAWSQRLQILTSTPEEATHLRAAYAGWVEDEGLDLRSLHPARTSFTLETDGELVYHQHDSCRAPATRGAGALLPHPAMAATLCRDCHTSRDLVDVPFAANLATSRFLEEYALTCIRQAATAREATRALRELSCHAVFTPGHQGLRSDPYSERVPDPDRDTRPEHASWVQKLRDSEKAADRAHAQMLRDGTLARVVELHTGAPAGELVWFVLHAGMRHLAIDAAGPWAFTWRTRAEHGDHILVEAPHTAYAAVADHVTTAEPPVADSTEPVLQAALEMLKTTDTPLRTAVAALT